MARRTRTMPTKRSGVWLVLMLVASLPRPALAGVERLGKGTSPATSEATTPSPEALDRARAAFRAGTEALSGERFEDAVREFEFALAVKETAGLRYYLGLAELGAGRFRAAATALERAKVLNGDDPKPDVAKVLPEAFARLERETPRLRLVGLPSEAKVTLDGELLAERDFAVDLGAHRLAIEAEGFERLDAEISLARGERRRVDVVLRRKARPPAPIVAEAEAGESVAESGDGVRAAVFWSSVGVAVAGTAVGVVGVVVERGASARVEESRAAIDEASGGSLGACTNATGGLASSCDALAEGLRDQSLGTTLLWGGFIGAGVGVLGAVATHFLWPTSPATPTADVTADRFTLGVSGSF